MAKANPHLDKNKIPALDRRVWAESLSFTSYGVCVGIRANRKGTLDRLLRCLPPGWRPSRSRVVERLYSVVVGPESLRGKDHWLVRVYADEQEVTGAPTLTQAIDVFESDLQLFVAETAPRRVFVHAGAVGWRGKAIVMPGRSFSGKTSLVAALVKAGAIYYSDEYAVLDDQGRVHHYARPLSIRENSNSGKSKKHAVETLGGRSGIKPLPVGLVVVSKYKPGARWRPRGLSVGEGALELMANTVSARRQPERMLEAVGLVASQARILKGNRGEANQVVDLILETLDRH